MERSQRSPDEDVVSRLPDTLDDVVYHLHGNAPRLRDGPQSYDADFWRYAMAPDNRYLLLRDAMLEAGNSDWKRRVQFLIAREALVLSLHPCGNRVVQLAIELRVCPYLTQCILDRLRGHYVELSQNGFYSCEVVKTCITCTEGALRREIILELVSDTRLQSTIEDEYGCGVIETAIMSSEKPLLDEIVMQARTLADALTYSRNWNRIWIAVHARETELASCNAGANAGFHGTRY